MGGYVHFQLGCLSNYYKFLRKHTELPVNTGLMGAWVNSMLSLSAFWVDELD